MNTKDTMRFKVIAPGDRWRCIGCASCCHIDFEQDWLAFIVREAKDPPKGNRCPNLRDDDRCRIYLQRSNPCRGFPFTLRKDGEGNHRLVIHEQCKGLGKGPKLDIHAWMRRLVRLANREHKGKYRIELTCSDGNLCILETVAVGMRKRKKRPQL